MASPLTFIAALKHAPYPYDGRFGDTRRAFFDTTHDGQRAHTTGRDTVFTEQPHYSDNRALFHVPAQFDAALPFAIVVFFLGHNGELRRTVLGELQIARQIDQAQRNVILIAPQLARDAADSAPGKLFRRNGLKNLLDEAAVVLAKRLGSITMKRLRSAPLILAAYSGGYRATAYSLDRGGVAKRIKGIVLLDALYGEEERLAAWMEKDRGFAVVLGGPSTNEGHMALERRLRSAGRTIKSEIPPALAPGELIFKMTVTSHNRLPLLGPPKWPMAAVLKAAWQKM